MTLFLELEELLTIAAHVVGPDVAVRDVGLLDSAAARPRASAFGEPAYVSLHEQAAALLHSLVSHHALVDGNKRLGLAAVIVFYSINDHVMTWSNDAAYDLVIAIADGTLRDVPVIAAALGKAVAAR